MKGQRYKSRWNSATKSDAGSQSEYSSSNSEHKRNGSANDRCWRHSAMQETSQVQPTINNSTSINKHTIHRTREANRHEDEFRFINSKSKSNTDLSSSGLSYYCDESQPDRELNDRRDRREHNEMQRGEQYNEQKFRRNKRDFHYDNQERTPRLLQGSCSTENVSGYTQSFNSTTDVVRPKTTKVMNAVERGDHKQARSETPRSTLESSNYYMSKIEYSTAGKENHGKSGEIQNQPYDQKQDLFYDKKDLRQNHFIREQCCKSAEGQEKHLSVNNKLDDVESDTNIVSRRSRNENTWESQDNHSAVPEMRRNDNEILNGSDSYSETEIPLSRNRNEHRKSGFIIGFRFLRGLLEKHNDSSHVLMQITKSKEALKNCLIRATDQTEVELLQVLLQVIAKAYSCNTAPHALITLFQSLVDANFLNSVTLSLIDFKSRLETMRKGELHKLIETLKNILQIIWGQITRNPSSFSAVSRILTTTTQLFDDVTKTGAISINKEIVELRQRTTEQKKNIEKQHKTRVGQTDEPSPPDDFRKISLIPTAEEIKDAHPFLRKNKVEGTYKDLDDYLDTQFRLLREDFIAPIREGIEEYIESVKAAEDSGRKELDIKRLQNIKIYNNVYCFLPVLTEHGLCYKMKIEMNQRLQRMNWSYNKRLIFGSLVCFSEDGFNTIYLATVVDRDEIKNGFLTIHFEMSEIKAMDVLNKTFVMAESSAYFEAYRHILSALKNIQSGDMCFEEYIVACENKVKPPAYLSTNRVYDLRPLVDDGFVIHASRRLYEIGKTIRGVQNASFRAESKSAENVSILEYSSWPDRDLLHLDESQYKALQSALTKEFAIIQGPPGTGKTYIGLQIVKALLHNQHIWAQNMDSSGNSIRPMLIVCYTNHALDQFVIGITKFFKGDVLRVGGRSENPDLNEYNLKTYRHKPIDSNTPLWQLRRDRETSLTALQEYSKKLSISSLKMTMYKTEIVKESVLRPYMGNQLFSSLLRNYHENRSTKKISVMMEWLGIQDIINDCERRSQHVANNNNADNEDLNDNDERQAEMITDENNEIMEAINKGRNTSLDAIRSSEIAFSIRDEKNNNNDNKSNQRKNSKNTELKETQKMRCNKLLKRALAQRLSSPDIMSLEEAQRVTNVWTIDTNSRWRLYRLLIKQLCESMVNDIDKQMMEFEAASERCKEALMQENKEIMRQSSVIAMTTTCAAKFQSVLKEIGPRIVIVEEAAEVLEAHIIATLSKNCEHLILIGDHQQLRPNPSVYKLSVKYNLNISLFERMIKNDVSYNCLKLQHRMRPEIADIVRHIYPELEDHEDVKKYKNVKGVSANLCFINHEEPENSDGEINSYCNAFEADYTIAFYLYLLKQGYNQSQITILTTYTGQLLYIRRRLPKEEFEFVRIVVVDNYQGEENDIVILSLVRSNDLKKIGFLKIENRICVALSRAKIGFFVLGNFDHLSRYSILWEKITADMIRRNYMHGSLELHSVNHPDSKQICVKQAGDFYKAPEGCCSKRCEARLPCGHVCEKFCHVLDPDHKEYDCQKRCEKMLCDANHQCPDRCYEICAPCRVPVQKILYECGHLQNVPCAKPPERLYCKRACITQLPCGHKCKNKCGESHTKNCEVEVDVTLSCGHSTTCYCWEKDKVLCEVKVPVKFACGHLSKCRCCDKEDVRCPKPCDTVLSCSHVCQGTCGTCYNNRLHIQCKNECMRILVCGHECQDVCNNCPPCQRPCENRCLHSRCLKTCGEPCAPCQERCLWQCKHFECTQKCSEPCDRPPCNRPCPKILKCKHSCIGLCGETCPEQCRICNKDEVTEILFGDEDDPDSRFVQLQDCGHIIEYKALDKYMAMEDENKDIQFKLCPRCKTAIRKNCRYGKYINESLNDIERVKEIVIGDTEKIKLLRTELGRSVLNLSPELAMGLNIKSSTSTRFLSRLVGKNRENKLAYRYSQFKDKFTERQLTTFKNQCDMLNEVLELQRSWTSESKRADALLNAELFQTYIDNLKEYIQRDRDILTDQELEDFYLEFSRMKIFVHLAKVTRFVKEARKLDESAKDLVKSIEEEIISGKRFTKDKSCNLKICFEKLQSLTKVEGLGIDEDEKKMILLAVGLSKGHWFKCPNNHIYAIGDCGGANQKGTCPECKADIGGEHHQLTVGNRLAPEMDGASFAAYSEEANNMFNFNLNDLF